MTDNLFPQKDWKTFPNCEIPLRIHDYHSNSGIGQAELFKIETN